MKAALEKIEPAFGSSFSVKKFDQHKECRNPLWHFHPEFEIVFVSNGSGKRHIGDHISYYEDGDLIFLGPNLPHFGFTDELQEQFTEVVIQMQEHFLGIDFFNRPEMEAIRGLFERAKSGLTFNKAVKEKLRHQLLSLSQLGAFEKLISLLTILQELAQTEDYELLNANGFSFAVNAKDHQRMRTIYEFVDREYQQQFELKDMAKEVSMTVPAFCRYFKKLTDKTFTQFVNEYRVNVACRLLRDKDWSIAAVSFESGFNNLSHFNKHFKLVTGMSPSIYRKGGRKVINNVNVGR